MKKLQFIIICVLIILGFGILYYQNTKIYRVANWIDHRDADIYKYLEWDKQLEKDIEDMAKKISGIQTTLDYYGGLIYRLAEGN